MARRLMSTTARAGHGRILRSVRVMIKFHASWYASCLISAAARAQARRAGLFVAGKDLRRGFYDDEAGTTARARLGGTLCGGMHLCSLMPPDPHD
jgi:hypothetical protein